MYYYLYMRNGRADLPDGESERPAPTCDHPDLLVDDALGCVCKSGMREKRFKVPEEKLKVEGKGPGTAIRCVDIDECAEGTYTCNGRTKCVNKDDGYTCEKISWREWKQLHDEKKK